MPKKKTEERLGFLRSDSDISYFITYIMTLLPKPITYPDLLDICLIDEAFGYFEFQIQFARLVEKGIIFEDKTQDPPLYFATSTCYDNKDAVKNALPVSVRDKAQAAVNRVTAKIKRNADIHTSYVENEDGTYNLTLSVASPKDVLFKLEVMLINKTNVDVAIENFKKNAEYYYREYLSNLLDFPEDE